MFDTCRPRVGCGMEREREREREKKKTIYLDRVCDNLCKMNHFRFDIRLLVSSNLCTTIAFDLKCLENVNVVLVLGGWRLIGLGLWVVGVFFTKWARFWFQKLSLRPRT